MALKNKNKNAATFIKIGAILIIVGLVSAHFFISKTPALAQDDIDSLNGEIQDRQSKIDSLQKQIEQYNQKIQQKQAEAKTLNNQIAILVNDIARLELDIQASQEKIDQANLEIQALNINIKQTEGQISEKKGQIKEFINLIYKNDQVGYLEILLTKKSFSQVYDYFKNTQAINGDLKKTLDNLKVFKNQLNTQLSDQEEKKQAEEKLKDELMQQKSSLDEKNTAQQILYSQAKLSQRQYQNLAYQAQLEQQQINAEVAALEKQVREQQAQNAKFQALGPANLIWPVNPGRGITTYFHDKDYPFRYLFEHSGLDIRAAQGTTIKAPADGYVAKVQFRGDKSYAYMVIVHSDGISTLFGHISKPLVSQGQYVTQGQAVALTGATPGTVGAGPYTTGPHLHFEVRLNGIPVNPLTYLPPI